MKAVASVSSTSSGRFVNRTSSDPVQSTGSATVYVLPCPVKTTTTEKMPAGARVYTITYDAVQPLSLPITPLADSTGRKFKVLLKEWKEATQFSSAVTTSFLHPAYQRIIGMGKAVLPAILRELGESPDYWFWAIDAIAGEKILPDDFNGGFDETVQHYLAWGKKHRYVE